MPIGAPRHWLGSLPLVAAAVGAACGDRAGQRSDDSGITGRVVPCGIVLERPAPCVDATPGAVGTVVVGQRDHVVRGAKVRADGAFRVPLDAGHYWLQATHQRHARPAHARDSVRRARGPPSRWSPAA